MSDRDSDAEATPEPRKKKKKKRPSKKRAAKKKRRRPPAESPEPSSKPAGESADDAKEGGGVGRYLWLIILCIAVFEIWLFGRRGHIEICVAKDGVHDFALLGQTRTDDNTRQFPTCEKRFNLGVTSNHEEAVKDAMLRACHRANILRGKEATLLCAIKEDGWKHRVLEEHCPPWHDHYYQRMFWFLQ